MKKIAFFVYAALMVTATFYSCNKAPDKPDLDDRPKRPIQPALGKTELTAIIDTMQFGTFYQGNHAYLRVRDTATDSLFTIEFNYQTDKDCSSTVDSENLAGDSMTINWYSNKSYSKDSTFVEFHYPNRRRITIDVLSNWELVYTLGITKVNLIITPQTYIIFGTRNELDSEELMWTGTSNRNNAIEEINSTFLNDFAQPEFTAYFGKHDILYTPCQLFILRE